MNPFRGCKGGSFSSDALGMRSAATFSLRRDQGSPRVGLRVLLPVPPSNDTEPPPAGWVSLFNGKDLSGWKFPAAGMPNPWIVKDGAISFEAARSAAGREAALFSERDDYRNLHLRLECKIASGGSGINVRALPNNINSGYHAHIGGKARTGRLFIPDKTGVRKLVGMAPDSFVPANTWFTLEMIVRGNQCTVKVDGKVTADYVDAEKTWTQGAIFLWAASQPETRVWFRKIEVRELPATAISPAPQTGGPRTVELLPLIDLAKDAVPSGQWERKGTDLIGKGGTVEAPYLPPKEYDLTVEFTRLEGDKGPEFMLALNGKSFRWTTGGGGQWYGPLWVDDTHWRVTGPPLKLGQRHQVRIVVRENGFGGFVNGNKVDWLKYTGQKLRNPVARTNGTVGLRVVEGATAFHLFELNEITGHGQSVRPLVEVGGRPKDSPPAPIRSKMR